MAEQQTAAAATAIPNELLENWANVRLAHEGVMVDKVQRASRIVEWLAKHAADGKYDASDFPADDMGVSIGNKIYVTQPGTDQTSTQPAVQQPESSKPSIVSHLVGPAIGAVTLAAGLGLGSWLLRDKPEPTTQPMPVASDADRDWKASAYVSKPE